MTDKRKITSPEEIRLPDREYDHISWAPFMGSFHDHPAEVIPRSFKAGTQGYLVSCTAPVLLVAFFAIVLAIVRPGPLWASVGFATSLLLILFLLRCLRKLNLEITSEGISYSSPFSQTRFIGYTEISAVVLIDYRYGLWRGILKWTVIVTPKAAVGKATLTIPLTFFPSEASTNLIDLLQPEVWRPQSDVK
jgi:hypothetical protein